MNVKAIARRLPKLSESRSPPLLLFLTEQGFEEYAISCRNLSRIRHLLPPLCIRREDLYFPAQTQVAGVPKLSARPRLKPYAHAPHRSVTPSFYFISFIRWGRRRLGLFSIQANKSLCSSFNRLQSPYMFRRRHPNLLAKHRAKRRVAVITESLRNPGAGLPLRKPNLRLQQ